MPVSGAGSPGRAPPPPVEGAHEEEDPGRPHEALDLGVGAAAREVPALPVVQVSSSSSGEQEEEEEDAQGPYLPSCPVCMSPWSADGEHRCPQCGKVFRQKHIINLYAPEIVVPNNDLEKQVLSLRHKNESLENQQKKLVEEIKEYKRQILLQQHLINTSSSKRQMTGQLSNGAAMAESVASLRADGDSSGPCKFVPQNVFFLDGARVMGIDASSQIILASGRAAGVSVEHVLTKISMFSRQETKVHLPPNTKALKDICIVPGGLAVFASLGKKLSLFSMITNNVVLQYDLPAPGWSCSGVQNGAGHALMRRTSSTSFVKEQICNGSVSELRMSKSAIIPCSGNSQHLFAYGDESLHGVRTWQLPSFQSFADLMPHRRPILDLRFAESSGGEKYLGCLSEEKLQVFKVIDH